MFDRACRWVSMLETGKMNDMSRPPFHSIVARWFHGRFGEPTEPQRLGWPHIAAGRDTLIAAPTGSGKTFAAFLVCIDRLVRAHLEAPLPDLTRILYVSPLKALSHDINENLQVPLEEINALISASTSSSPLPIRAAVRTGDASSAERRAMLRRPPHILVTTPESLYLLLTSDKGRVMLRTVDTVIVDEIHALARDKRGSHLALSLERLEALCLDRPVRIGLSATQRPIDDIARFLVGTNRIDSSGAPDCAVVDVGHRRTLDLGAVLPPSDLSAVCSNEQWDEMYRRLAELIDGHRSTVVFVNTRRMAERLTLRLSERLGADVVLAHHGSLSKRIRRNTEHRLRSGALKAVVATASLELGIDIGYIDLVVQIGSPRSIATFLQRVGRSGHALGRLPKGRVVPLTRDELVECAALLRAVRAGRLDRIDIPEAPLDILAQQMVAEAACREMTEEELFDLCRRAWPYRGLTKAAFDAVLEMLTDGFAGRFGRSGAYLHHDRIGRRIKARRGGRIAALTSGGAIPEVADYRVVTEPDQTVVGSVDEDFAVESMSGDIFLLGSTSWRILHVRGGDVVVADAHGAPPTIPFWRGEAPGRTRELSTELSELREELVERLAEPEHAVSWLRSETGLDEEGARQIASYLAAQQAAIGVVPTQRRIVIERFFDDTGGTQVVIHAPYGSRINRAWGLALRKRFCRTFDFELQSSADDNAILFSLGPQQNVSGEEIPAMIEPGSARDLLVQAILAVPMFMTRWRWNANRSLAILRVRNGRRVPPPLQRMRADDLLVAVFPQQMACRENLPAGPIPIPDHPLVAQTVHDCLHEAMDVDSWLDLLRAMTRGEIEITAVDTREPSPFSYGILNAYPYAFLDDAPLEERRARAVATRRTLTVESIRDLGALDPEAIEQVRREAWPLVRDADELYDALMLMGAMAASESLAWAPFFDQLLQAGRVVEARFPEGEWCWVAIERWPMVQAAWPDALRVRPSTEPLLHHRAHAWTIAEADVELVRGRLEVSGPTTVEIMAAAVALPIPRVEAALAALEHEGFALRAAELGWCARRLLARIHRLTLDRLRRQIEPVGVELFLRFLFQWNHLAPGTQLQGPDGLMAIVGQLQGFEAPAAVWERYLLPQRMSRYEPHWLDELCLGGDVTWGRVSVLGQEPPTDGRTRSVGHHLPLSLMAREDIDWIRWRYADASDPLLSHGAQAVLKQLTQHGASFMKDFVSSTRLLPSQLDEALRELVAVGAITADSFAQLRTLIARRRISHRRPRPARPTPRGHGRWTRLQQPTDLVSIQEGAATEHEVWQHWARLLLRRYGILFKDLLTREVATPPWYRLLPALRRMESRGEVRGGRFVLGVGGEQYGLSEAVDALRRLRDQTAEPEVICVSSADPANLVGVLTPDPRVRVHRETLIAFSGGRFVGTREAGQINIIDVADQKIASKIREALTSAS